MYCKYVMGPTIPLLFYKSHNTMKFFTAVALALWLVLSIELVHSQVLIKPSHLNKRLNDVCLMLSKSAIQYDTLFAPEFLAQVPAAQLGMISDQLSASVGICSSVHLVSQASDFTGKAEIYTSKNFAIPVDISVEEKSPHRIIGLLLRSPVMRNTGYLDVIEELEKLPGTTSICIRNLTTNTTVLEKDTSVYLPLGSTFKLYILGELTRSIQKGTNKWQDVIMLDSTRMSFPSGVLHTWPHNSPITLHTLASEMMSISDNTATDHVLHFLKRENVEKMQQVMGHSKPTLNIPFLSTAELFRLKFTHNSSYAYKYLKSTPPQKLSLLNDTLPGIPRKEVVFRAEPILPDSLEWFARTPDACRAMQWFYQQRTTPAGAAALNILSINHGVEVNETAYSYVGFKGGSETGVINLTLLLHRADDTWFAVSASWLNPKAAVQEIAFVSAVNSVLKLLEK